MYLMPSDFVGSVLDYVCKHMLLYNSAWVRVFGQRETWGVLGGCGQPRMTYAV
jgi:hypothetical protein